MAIQPAVCTNCGGNLKVDDTDLNGFCTCEFCHTPHKVIDIITVDGLPTVKSLLATANFCVQDGNCERAASTYREALKIKPNCHEAWWGLYICNAYFDRYYGYKDKYGNSGPITKASIMLNTINKYAARAIEYAPPAQAQRYKDNIQSDLDYIEQVRQGLHDKKTAPAGSSSTAGGGSSGCYIATAVYGDYTCNEVMALRRYRDDYLANRRLGRAFIRLYYRVSPTLAKHIKPDSRLGKAIRKYLDKKVSILSI